MDNFKLKPQQHQEKLKHLLPDPTDLDGVNNDRQSLMGENMLLNYGSSLTDMTGEVGMKERQTFFGTHDFLTSLPNRHHLYEALDALCKDKANPFSILYLVLERFSVINESFGPLIGDDVLKKLAHRLNAIVSEKGFVSRFGNNVFVIVTHDFEHRNHVIQLAKTILNEMEKPIESHDFEIQITTNIGISLFPEHGTTKLTLLEKAHLAFYDAKDQGKNKFQIYSLSESVPSFRKYVTEKDLRQAVENAEFELHYQPIVDPQSGTIQSAEALMRWDHHEWGGISPNEFIPLAEESHFIYYMTKWIIEEVCSQLRKWKDEGYTLRPIAINISPISFFRKGFVEFVKAQLGHYQILPKYLIFEMAESSLLINEQTALLTVKELKQLGVQIAIEDFGTGYASLGYLREFKTDLLKIDKTIIQNVGDITTTDSAIISSILHLADRLDMKVVAVGVEEHEQLEFLKQKECHLVQGFLFSKPVPKETFGQLLETGYLIPEKKKTMKAPEVKKRDSYRFEFPYMVRGHLTIVEVNKRKVDLGSAEVLIENISLGGMKIYTTLRFPINSDITFRFNFTLMDEPFNVEGALVRKIVGKGSTLYYGIQFKLNGTDENRLSRIINRMSLLRRGNNEIPHTDFIYEDPYVYLSKKNN